MRAVAVLCTLLTLLMTSTIAGAQSRPQPARTNPKPPADQPIPAGEQKAWVKLCDDVTTDGKDGKTTQNVCLTSHERLDGNTGTVVVSVAIRQVQGQDKQALMVMVPLGVLEQPGLKVDIYPQDLWQKMQKAENVDNAKLYELRLNFTLCHAAGCTAETDADADTLAWMKRGGGLVVLVTASNGQLIGIPAPLAGFAQAYEGPPVDSKTYAEARQKLLDQIAERQKQQKQQTGR
jgi:invasion protein IalB